MPLLALLLLQLPAAPLTVDHYRRAEQFLAANAERLVFHNRVTPRWIAGSDRFWYRVRTGDASYRFRLADPARRSVTDAFDHVRLATALGAASGAAVRADSLPFDTIAWSARGDSLTVPIGAKRWRCSLGRWSCVEAAPPRSPEPGAAWSPDSSMRVVRVGGDLGLRRGADTTTARLTSDAEPEYDYGSMPGNSTYYVSSLRTGAVAPPAVLWSPDGRRFVSYRLDQRGVGLLHLLQLVPDSVQRPRPFAFRYALPGDSVVTRASLIVFDPARGTAVPVQLPPSIVLYVDPITWNEVRWSADGQRLYVMQSERGGHAFALYQVDPETGTARRLAEERNATLAEPSLSLGQRDFHPLADGKVIWLSERDGWAHLYLVDGRTGGVIRRLTSGPWVVIRLLRVDEAAGQVYFLAAGREPGRDPYLRHLYRVSFDGTGLTLLTPEDSDHEIGFAPSGRWFVDRYSRWDRPPVTALRSANGETRVELERADVAKLVAAGWRAPERLRLVAGDGRTEIFGNLYRPRGFDFTRRYPVIEEIYPGPQANQAYPWFQAGGNAQALAQLGFVTLQVDGRGTPYRSKAFHDYSYGRLETGGGLEDHVAALGQLARRYPWFDTSRVGIFGHSGGGFASTRAILMYPDVYKVAVASAGNHDQRGYLAIWGESYQGMPAGANYDAQANQSLAGSLKGKLLLMTGDLDDNVHPMLTMRVADALIRANKDFDLMVIPNANHGSAGSPWFIRRRWDYFVRNLLGAEPPRDFRLAPPGR